MPLSAPAWQIAQLIRSGAALDVQRLDAFLTRENRAKGLHDTGLLGEQISQDIFFRVCFMKFLSVCEMVSTLDPQSGSATDFFHASHL
jgi:hypothetical protein